MNADQTTIDTQAELIPDEPEKPAAIVQHQPEARQELALPQDTGAAMLAIISRAASDPSCDVDKMERLLQMKERMDASNAKKAFAEALHGFQSECPQIHRGKWIEVKGEKRSRFAAYEDMMTTVQPVMQKWGFSATFDSNTNAQNGRICSVTCTLSHIGGHSVQSTFPVMPDETGSKNSIQAIGSALSYGKRYSLGAVLGLVFTNEDDDGKATSAAAEAREEIAVELPPKARAKADSKPAPQEDPEASRQRNIETIRAMMDEHGLVDEDMTKDLNRALGPKSDLPEWTDAPDKVLARLATKDGFANVAQLA